MPDLAEELHQLRIADRHIAAAELRVFSLGAEIEERRRLGQDVALSEQVLQTLREGLDTFRLHRDLIARMVDDLRDGPVRDR